MRKSREFVKELFIGILFFTVCLTTFIIALHIRAYAAPGDTQAEARVVEAIPDKDNPYRAIILNATPEEIQELEQILNLEAESDTFEGRIATLQVMLNRVMDPRFPNTIHGVLSQKGQYVTWKNRHKAHPGEAESDAIAWLCNGEPWQLTTDYIFQSRRGMGKEKVKIGKQVFGK